MPGSWLCIKIFLDKSTHNDGQVIVLTVVSRLHTIIYFPGLIKQSAACQIYGLEYPNYETPECWNAQNLIGSQSIVLLWFVTISYITYIRLRVQKNKQTNKVGSLYVPAIRFGSSWSINFQLYFKINLKITIIVSMLIWGNSVKNNDILSVNI